MQWSGVEVMSEQLREALSAMVDGEADEFETRRVLNELALDAALWERWERYHLIAGSQQVLVTPAASARMLNNIWAAIDADEEAGIQPAVEGQGGQLQQLRDLDNQVQQTASAANADSRRSPRWLGPLAGGSIAASVALSVVLYMGGFVPDGTQSQIAETAPPRTAEAAMTLAAQTDGRQLSRQQLDLQRTQAYMLHHVHQTSLNHQASVMPFVKVAAFESR